MNNYWVGVVVGLLCSIILLIVAMFVTSAKIDRMVARMDSIEAEQEKIEEWIADNETVMRTYKFFNESWSAIIELNNKGKENNK